MNSPKEIFKTLPSISKASYLARVVIDSKNPKLLLYIFNSIVLCILGGVYYFTGYFNFLILFGVLFFYGAIHQVKFKNDLIMAVFFTDLLCRILICSIFIIACGARYFSESVDECLYLLILGLVWIPSFEFIKYESAFPVIVFAMRISVTVLLGVKYLYAG